MAQPNVAKIAYKTLQQSKGIAGLLHKELSSSLMRIISPDSAPETEKISYELISKLREAIAQLEEKDWQEAEEGIYPKRQLFEAPWLQWASHYPLVWLDLPSTWERRKKRKTREFPNQINKEIYPDYYLQNFHHQTDGYLSDHSARLYDLQVEILFNGTADAMRRRVLAPLKRGLNKFNSRNFESMKVLDVATGTGRVLKQIRASLPQVELLGLDLSSSYLKQASKYLNNGKSELAQLVLGNAEDLPFPENSIQAITCVFLLHELPQKARFNVLRDCWRVLEPGGVLILADSIQMKDSPQFNIVMENFHEFFHEPYYKDYIKDDIDLKLKTIGFEDITAESHFMTRVWSGTKPY